MIVEGSVESLRDERIVELRPSECTGGDAPNARMRLAWKGPVPDSEWQPGDERLRDELRALGYLH
jgi:hypothetical protein